MAHEIYVTRAGKASMAFVGETPWHGLGNALTEGAPLETWAREAGFEWQALSAPVEFQRGDGTRCHYGDKQAIYRSDTGAPLSVMGSGYKIVQPLEVIEFFRDLTRAGGWQLHTAGILKGGRLMWAMARNCAKGDVVPGDEVRSNLLLVTSLDGSTPTTGALVATRVVCANTVKMALDETRRGAKAARVSHRSTFDADHVKDALGVALPTFERFMVEARNLAGTSCDVSQATELLRGIFGQPITRKGAMLAAEKAGDTGGDLAAARSVLAQFTQGAQSTQQREQKSVARCLALFAGEGRGANHEGVKGTRWGLLNAVTEHIDHEQGRTADSRLQSAWFGRGDDFKQSALSALLAA
jgi:phage/plasmid-like protein (TIGR03299 family)